MDALIAFLHNPRRAIIIAVITLAAFLTYKAFEKPSVVVVHEHQEPQKERRVVKFVKWIWERD